MRLRTCSAALVGLTLFIGLGAAPATAAPAPSTALRDAQLLDACPAPTSTSDSNYYPSNPEATGHIDSITFSGSGSSRTAHIIGTGFRANSDINAVNWTAFCERQPALDYPRTDAMGRIEIDYSVVAGVPNYFHFDDFDGTVAFFADDSGGGTTPPEPPKPEAPTVTTTSTGQGLTRLTIRGTGISATVRDADGRIIAGTPLNASSGIVVIPTPTLERHYSITQTVAAVESRAADIVLSAGTGSAKPAPPVVRGHDEADFSLITFSVTGTPGATVKVFSEGSEHRLLAVKTIGASGAVDVARLPRAQAGNGGSLDQSAYVTQTVEGATSDPGYDVNSPLS